MENYIVPAIDRNAIVAESSKFLREMVTKSMTKQQLDIIITIASLVKEEDDDFKEYKITYRELGKIINPSNPRTKIVQDQVSKAVGNIMSSYFCIRTEENRTFYHWVEKAVMPENEDAVYFKLSKEVKQFYLNLQNGKTLYILSDLLNLSTLFQANLFRWLSANCNFANAVSIEINDAMLQFNGFENKLTTKKFIEKLNRSLEKVNSTTHINAKYEKIYEKKKLVRLDFYIENNYEKKKIEYFPSQVKANEEKKKKLWLENKELKEQNEVLANIVCLQNMELESKKELC